MTQELVATSTLLPAGAGLVGARLRLFESALVLFGDRGYHAVSVRDLMSAQGQQPGALYFHVPSKQALLYELSLIGAETHRALLKAALLDSGPEPDEQIRALTEAHVRMHLTYPELARVTNRETRSLTEEQFAEMMGFRREARQLFIDVIERGVRKGRFTAPDPELATYGITAMGVRAAEWWTPDTGRGIEEMATSYAHFAVKLLAPEPAAG